MPWALKILGRGAQICSGRRWPKATHGSDGRKTKVSVRSMTVMRARGPKRRRAVRAASSPAKLPPNTSTCADPTAGASPPYECSVRRRGRSEEHTSELQSRENLVCRLLLEKKKNHQHEGRSAAPRADRQH